MSKNIEEALARTKARVEWSEDVGLKVSAPGNGTVAPVELILGGSKETLQSVLMGQPSSMSLAISYDPYMNQRAVNEAVDKLMDFSEVLNQEQFDELCAFLRKQQIEYHGFRHRGKPFQIVVDRRDREVVHDIAADIEAGIPLSESKVKAMKKQVQEQSNRTGNTRVIVGTFYYVREFNSNRVVHRGICTQAHSNMEGNTGVNAMIGGRVFNTKDFNFLPLGAN